MSGARKTAARKSGASKTAASRSSRAKQSSRPAASRRSTPQSSNGVVDTLKSVAGKAGAPAMAVGAAAVGVAGGLALKGRTRQRKVLGVPVPELDVKSMAKNVGKASKQLSQTSKSVSKDIERVGDQAERLGKILD